MRRSDAPLPRLTGYFPCVFASGEDPMGSPQLGQCPMSVPMNGSGPVDRFEADLRYGSFVLRQTDVFVKDIFLVPLTRTYASLDWVHPNHVHAFGKNANHPYDIAPLGTRNPYTYMMIALEDSDFLFFSRISEGTGFNDAVYQHTETATKFYKATTRWNGSGWTVQLSDGSTILFPESYSAKNMAQGAPIEMRDAGGNKLLFQRDAQRNLVEILTPKSRSIKLTYDDQSRIIQSESNQGQWARYQYANDGLLSDVVFSSGAERHYSYEGVQMTSIKDERGRVLVHNHYVNRMLTRQDFANGSSWYYRYEMAPNGSYVESVAVTLPNGNITTVHPADAVAERVKNPPTR